MPQQKGSLICVHIVFDTGLSSLKEADQETTDTMESNQVGSEFDFDKEIDRRKEQPQTLKWHRYLVGEDGEHLFPAGVADMDFQCPPVVKDALQRRLDHGIFGYEEDPEGLDEAVIAWHEKRHGWKIDPEPWTILRSPNVLTSLAVASTMIPLGSGIIVQPPVFFDFFDVINENKREVVKNPLLFDEELGRYFIDFEGLEAQARKPEVKMLYFCNPHNPIGRAWTVEELQRVAKICAQNDVMIVSDEIHADIVYPSAVHSTKFTPFGAITLPGEKDLQAKFQNLLISCISPAKSFNIASCCYSFTIIPGAELRKRFQAENSRYSFNKNNAFSSVAMEAAYRGGEPWLSACVEYLEGNLKLVRDTLRQSAVSLVEPDASFLLWLDFRGLGLTTDEELTAFLRDKAEWSITRGISFGPEGSMFGRVNIACPRERLRVALEKLVKAVRECSQRGS